MSVITRRAFLNALALTTLGFMLSGCAAGNSASLSAKDEEGIMEKQSDGVAVNSRDEHPSRLGAAVVPMMVLNDGNRMPQAGIGTYSLQGAVCIDALKSALSQGVRLIDTAYMYGNEVEVGRAVRESGVSRDEVFIITKLYPSQFAQASAAIDEALAKLDLGYIDMMLLHHPGTDDVKAYKAMEKARGEGKIRSLGLSNWYADTIDGFIDQVDIAPALVQNEMHPYYQDTDTIERLHELGIVAQAWYPLGGRGYNSELIADPTLASIAQAHGVSIANVMLRWNAQRGVSVIPGSSDSAHIGENTRLFDWKLSPDEMQTIAALERREKHDWY